MSRESPSDASRSSKHGKSSKPSVASRVSHGLKGDLPKGDLYLDELSASATQARTEMVQKVLEGLREEAFELARDIGFEVLTQPGGLRKFVEKLRDVVFPRASEEARELFKVGQKPGSLARQNGESMLSYVSRRRRGWKQTLDGSIELSRERSRSPVPERAAASSSRRVSVAEPDAEHTPTRRSTRDTTDNLPMQIRDHFTRIRESETPGDAQAQASIAVRSRTELIAFMVSRVLTKEQVEHQRELKDLPGNLDYRTESPTVQSYIDGSRRKEWKKYEDFQAAIPLKGKELSDLLEAGHVPIPSKWVDTIKNIHEKQNPIMCLNSSRG